MAKELARGAAEVALKLAEGSVTRDALQDPKDTDYIPDVDTKGYHVGEVRQPAEPVLHAGNVVTFESVGDGESKFSDYEKQVQAVDEITRNYDSSEHKPITVTDAEIRVARGNVPSAEPVPARAREK